MDKVERERLARVLYEAAYKLDGMEDVIDPVHIPDRYLWLIDSVIEALTPPEVKGDVAEVCEKLLHEDRVYNGRGTFRPQRRNPDGPEAVALLKSQAAEIARLRGAVRQMATALTAAICLATMLSEMARAALSIPGDSELSPPLPSDLSRKQGDLSE